MKNLPKRLRIYFLILAIVVVLGIPGLMITEGLSFFNAIYFLIVTIATVGYGDIYPVTPSGRLIVLFVIFGGVGSFIGLIANFIETWLNEREQQNRLEKLNILIGAFFSEIGTKVLSHYSFLDTNTSSIAKNLIVTGEWSEDDFVRMNGFLKQYNYSIKIKNVDLENLRKFLFQKRDFLLRLLENPVVFEHESFTELLRSLFHLTDELALRGDFGQLPATDYAHLENDIKRSYAIIAQQWLEYMKYLKERYPYLFSLAMRTNPFDHNASVIVT